FFFFDFEKQPRREPGRLLFGALPQPGQLTGNFVGAQTIYDPNTGQPFPNNTIPSLRIDPVAGKIAAAIPKPNTTGTNNYFVGVPRQRDDYRVAARGDQKLTSTDQVFGRFQNSHTTSPSPSLFTGSILSADGGVNVEHDLSEIFQGSDTATWIHGRHLIKIGWEYRHISFLSTASSFAPEGLFKFDGHYTAGTGSTGEPFADFLLGLP